VRLVGLVLAVLVAATLPARAAEPNPFTSDEQFGNWMMSYPLTDRIEAASDLDPLWAMFFATGESQPERIASTLHLLGESQSLAQP
jgi:hypothetical protein